MGRRVRFVLFGTLLLLQAATIGVLWSFSGQASQRAVGDHLEALLMTAAEEAAIHTAEFISPAEDTIAVAAEVARDAGIATPGLERAFLQQMQRNPQLAGLYVATPEGDFFFVSRVRDGFRTKIISTASGRRRVQLIWRDANGGLRWAGDDPDDAYDPTTRPWYQDAVVGEGIRWTEPYVFFTSQRLGTTAAMAVHARGELAAVVGADIELDALSQFLTTLRLGEQGGAVITSSRGSVIAHPMPELTRAPAPGGGTRPVMLSDLGDPVARLATQVVRAAGEERLGTVVPVEAPDGAARAVGRSVPAGDVEWSIVIHASDDDFVGAIQQAQRRDRQLLLALGVIALALGAGALLPATKPIERLARQAATDPLTQLDNRRSAMARAELVARANHDRCFVIIDLDRFKEVNDRYGHVIGDEVLEAVAGRLARAVRPTDHLGRIGGEEFLLILDEATWAESEPIVERARRTLSQTPIVTSAGLLTVTASFGAVHATVAGDRATLLSVADEALRQAKRMGRNRVRAARYDGDDQSTRVTIDLSDRTSVTSIALKGLETGDPPPPTA